MDDRELFLRKMRAMSIIKGELMRLGKDPGAIERVLMDEYDKGVKDGVNHLMTAIDIDSADGLKELMKEVLKKV